MYVVDKRARIASDLKQADDKAKGIGTFIMIVLGILALGALAEGK